MLAALSAAFRNALILVGAAYLIAAIAIGVVVFITIFFLCRALLQYRTFWPARAVCCPETKLKGLSFKWTASGRRLQASLAIQFFM